MTRAEMLKASIARREKDILEYQVNIDVHRKAIARIQAEHRGNSPMDVALREYANQLEALVQSALIEQRKTIVLRDAAAEDLREASHGDF